MNSYKKILTVIFFLCCLSCATVKIYLDKNASNEDLNEKTVDIALCLDLSASTNELVADIKSQIWDIYNNFNKFKPTPTVRMALIGAGRAAYKKENDYIKILCPLTRNIDELASSIYSITPEIKVGKNNNVGSAISEATKSLKWSKNPSSIKLIYIIGNGRLKGQLTDPYYAASEAIAKGIDINTVFCVNEKNGKEISEWRDLSDAGHGDFRIFDPKKRPKYYLPSAEIYNLLQKLNSGLNNSYYAYSPDGDLNKSQIIKLDSGAISIHPMVYQQRIILKGSNVYQGCNSGWDLIDAYDRFKLKDIRSQQDTYINQSLRISDKIRDMNKVDLDKLVAQKRKERTMVLNDLRKLSPLAESFIEKEKPDVKQQDPELKNLLITSINKNLEMGNYEKLNSPK